MSSSAVVEKMPKMAEYGPKFNTPKCLNMAHDGSKWPKLAIEGYLSDFGLLWTTFWSFWNILCHFEPLWAILGHFGPYLAIFCNLSITALTQVLLNTS